MSVFFSFLECEAWLACVACDACVAAEAVRRDHWPHPKMEGALAGPTETRGWGRRLGTETPVLLISGCQKCYGVK